MESARFAENLAIFVEVAQAQSFSSVARRRGMVASSVARQIDALERELDVALFTRSTRALVLTDAGDLLFERATRILHDLSDTRDAVTALEQGVSGLLRVSCLPAFGRRHIVPHLAALYAQFPRLRVELVLTERIVDPVVERFDVVVRVGQQPDSNLVARRLAPQRYLVCASPAYLVRHGRPVHASELDRHRLIDRGHSTSMRGWRELLPAALAAPERFALECDDCDARRLSVLDGLGIALMPDWSVGGDIGEGRLVELALEGLGQQPETGIFVLRATPRANAKVKAFCAHLSATIGDPPRWRLAMANVAPAAQAARVQGLAEV